MNFGDWVGQHRELDPRQVAGAEMTGYLLRSYTHRTSGETFQVLLICGKPGPTSLHPPDVCYQGAGYATDSQELHSVQVPSLDNPAEFRVGRFIKHGPTPDPLRIYLGLVRHGDLDHSHQPALDLRRQSLPLQAVRDPTLPRIDEPLQDDPTDTFLVSFLPQIQKALFAATNSQPGGGRD